MEGDLEQRENFGLSERLLKIIGKKNKKEKRLKRMEQQQTNNGYLSSHGKTSVEKKYPVPWSALRLKRNIFQKFQNALGGCHILGADHVEKWLCLIYYLKRKGLRCFKWIFDTIVGRFGDLCFLVIL
ncbi:hypothetical protein CEXT_643041 [Caerostris extrusa]|uniref:Uncharacterized protein n=1 Tax=Caerostris extrusa TaxID=172846 RepID=A0AAV4XQT0_CAEEX|nr:hypothetical protein CEXT_643041 [Caerostris extrusa]